MEGAAVSLSPTLAPFSETEVVYCEAKAKQFRVKKGKIQSQFTETIYEACIDYPFLLKGDDGYVVVCPEDSFVDIVNTFDVTNYSHKIGGIEARLPALPMQQALHDAEVSFIEADGPVPIDFMESSIKNGDRIFVLGMRYNDPEAIAQILEGHPIREKEKIVGIFRHSEGKKEGLYLAPGNRKQAVGELLKYGISFIIWSTIIAAIATTVGIVSTL